MPVSIVWTQHADSRLLHLRAGGLPWHTVAADLRVGRNAAIERARRLGLTPLTRVRPARPMAVERIDRNPLPPGHPISWQAITDRTSLAGERYPYPVFL